MVVIEEEDYDRNTKNMGEISSPCSEAAKEHKELYFNTLDI